MKLIGSILGVFVTDLTLHIMKVLATGLKAETQMERIGAIGVGVICLLIIMAITSRLFSSSFNHGFQVATGLFLSFDIVVFHWVFQLHRITNGPEANWIEPILVIIGTILVFIGYKKEKIRQAVEI